MTNIADKSTSQRILALRSIFSRNRGYRDLEERFRYLLDRRRAEITAGLVAEARCIAIIGASGSGKTTAAEHLFKSQSDLVLEDAGLSRLDVASLQVPSPATLKFVGQTTLSALGFPLARDRTAQTIWDMVKDHLQGRQTLFLHYDEAQDLTRYQTPKELSAVVNTLKSLLQHKRWPVGLVLTGTPELKAVINHDYQLARRVYPIELARLNPVADHDRVTKVLQYYCDKAQLILGDDLLIPDFVPRLIHAADQEFGMLIEMLIAAMEGAMFAGQSTLSTADFSTMFRIRTGCIDGLNPFISGDFERIETRLLLGGGEL